MGTLSQSDIDAFWRDGYLVVANAVSADQLAALKNDFEAWVEQSRRQRAPFGDTLDGRPRFDLEPGHSESQPALRRVNAPIEISAAYHDVMLNSRMTDCVTDLVGPNVKLHHTKINSKLPGAATAVKWHQDFPFTPHSNDDLVTALLMVDDVNEMNGALEVAPGSHKGGLHSLWHDGRFTGAVTETVADECASKSTLCTGNAGSVCLMHTRLLHGSSANTSAHPRTLFICVYSAEDAVACSPNPVPHRYEGLLVRGERTNKVRATQFELELPQLPTTASFFDQQAKHG